jgi:peptide/nickel transport system permease protein
MRFEASDASMIGFVLVILAFICAAIFAPYLTRYGAGGDQNLTERFLPPLTQGHLLGTDHLGRDILTRLIFGARVSLGVGSTVVVFSGVVGTTLAVLSGYYGGLIDDVVNWLVNVQLAFPFILLAISVIAVLGPSLENVIIVLAIGGWPAYVRVIRSKVLMVRNLDFVEAARMVGARERRVMFRHILPNVSPPLMVLATFEFSRAVIAEAALSFLGLGPGGLEYSSWGLMLAEGKDYLMVAWWPATVPGVAIMAMALSINVVGDWLRDKLDPKLRI